MADEADSGNDTAELFLQAALRNSKANAIMPSSGLGFCLNCEDEIKPIPADPEGARRWCCAACRDDWSSAQKRNA